jgi:hypothetical protein
VGPFVDEKATRRTSWTTPIAVSCVTEEDLFLSDNYHLLDAARMSVIILRNELLLLCGVVHIVRESNRSQQTTKKKKHVLCVILLLLLLLASSSSRADGYCLLDVMMG